MQKRFRRRVARSILVLGLAAGVAVPAASASLRDSYIVGGEVVTPSIVVDQSWGNWQDITRSLSQPAAPLSDVQLSLQSLRHSYIVGGNVVTPQSDTMLSRVATFSDEATLASPYANIPQVRRAMAALSGDSTVASLYATSPQVLQSAADQAKRDAAAYLRGVKADGLRYQRQVPAWQSLASEPSSSGFDWRDFGIGVSSALLLSLLLAAAFLSVRQRQRLATA